MKPKIAFLALALAYLVPVFAQTNAPAGGASLPVRLVLLVDGVSYRDVKALQEGTGSKSAGNKRAFQDGYFPASRLISTFPSISDTSWPEILGIDPPPGYQRTYFNAATGSEVSVNGVTKLAGYEQKMTWQMEGSFRRIMSYSSPARSFKYELNEMIKHFLQSSGTEPNFYAMIQSIDTGQHSWGDVRSMLCTLDKNLQELRATSREHEGRELEILILSDHGNNHAGAGRRIAIKSFLKKHGYRLAKSLSDPKDVVLPTAGIESWAEIHNSPAETWNLVRLLQQLKGVDLVTARHPDQTNHFIVRNSKGKQAEIEWDAKKNSFKYQMQTGDPLAYGSVVEALASKGSIDLDGFATADDWKTETLTHRYPVALERIVRAHTKVALNPASILLSLENGYIHSKWLIRRALDFARSGGTHGGLDDISSTGVLLSNFAPTDDTSSSRVAALYDGFKGGGTIDGPEASRAEWVYRTSIGRQPRELSTEELFLRIRTPTLARLDLESPINVTIEKAGLGLPARIYRSDLWDTERNLVLYPASSLPAELSGDRTYAIPASLTLQPQTPYRISIWIREGNQKKQISKFSFQTGSRGLPITPTVEIERPASSTIAASLKDQSSRENE